MNAIVMGATSGIGMEVAKILANRGWKVGIAGRRVDRLKELKDSQDGIVCFRKIDVTSSDAPMHLIRLIEELGVFPQFGHRMAEQHARHGKGVENHGNQRNRFRENGGHCL